MYQWFECCSTDCVHTNLQWIWLTGNLPRLQCSSWGILLVRDGFPLQMPKYKHLMISLSQRVKRVSWDSSKCVGFTESFVGISVMSLPPSQITKEMGRIPLDQWMSGSTWESQRVPQCFERQFRRLYCDASDDGVGSMLCQLNEAGIGHPVSPVSYFSRKLDKAQRNYATMEWSSFPALGSQTLWCVCKFLPASYTGIHRSHPIQVFTDHILYRYSQTTSYTGIHRPHSIQVFTDHILYRYSQITSYTGIHRPHPIQVFTDHILYRYSQITSYTGIHRPHPIQVFTDHILYRYSQTTSYTGIHRPHPIQVFTDHILYRYSQITTLLSFVHKMKTRNQWLLHWSLTLQEYNVEVHHVKGRNNVVANALSHA